ncbi:MAG: NusG domain II-containing protein [Candidatus Choladocola sp.]|nr:NusG domain II-containing protein [Candidatus Choladocola sp.]
MKKADIILGISAVTAGILLFTVRSLFQDGGSYVTVEKNGEQFGTYSLKEDQEIPVGEGNCIRISDGCAYMESADCPDQLCVHQGRISANGEMIVCLPNRVVVQVGSEERDEDAPDAVVY